MCMYTYITTINILYKKKKIVIIHQFNVYGTEH